jgi:hypothetical protein
MNLFTVKAIWKMGKGLTRDYVSETLASSGQIAERMFRCDFIPNGSTIHAIESTKWENELDIDGRLTYLYQVKATWLVRKAPGVFQRFIQTEYLYGENVNQVENKFVECNPLECAEFIELATFKISDIE